ncbi:MAG: SDR family oxidoreductase [Verrucomicrobiales bacterium]|nr:SDR family oxidoreductase [Verrucomicrobiales bacterium]
MKDCRPPRVPYDHAMRVWIIGCGYVGTALGKRLLQEGHTVTGLCRTRERATDLAAVGIRPVIADLARAEELRRLRADCTHAVLCAASAGGDLETYRRIYVNGTANVLEWLADAPPTRLVYTGSTGVYGQNDGSDVDEESPTMPQADTARVLLETEGLLRQAAMKDRVPAVLLRVAGIYGPERGYWLRQFLAGTARLDGDGSRILNMIHRDDLVESILAALLHGRPGRIYNVVDNEPVRQRDLLGWLARRLNRPLPLRAEPGIATGGKGLRGSKRILNRRLIEELQVRLRHPTFREGFDAELMRMGFSAEPARDPPRVE